MISDKVAKIGLASCVICSIVSIAIFVFTASFPLMAISGITMYGAIFFYTQTAEMKRKTKEAERRRKEFGDRLMDKFLPKKEKDSEVPKANDRNPYYQNLDKRVFILNDEITSKESAVRELSDSLFQDSTITKVSYINAVRNASIIAKDNLNKCRTMAKAYGEYSEPSVESREILEAYVSKARNLADQINGILNEFAKVDMASTNIAPVSDRIKELKETTHLYVIK